MYYCVLFWQHLCACSNNGYLNVSLCLRNLCGVASTVTYSYHHCLRQSEALVCADLISFSVFVFRMNFKAVWDKATDYFAHENYFSVSDICIHSLLRLLATMTFSLSFCISIFRRIAFCYFSILVLITKI